MIVGLHARATRTLLALAAVSLGACSTLKPPGPAEMEALTGLTTTRADPWEPFNRSVFDFNEAVDGAVIKPIAELYRDWLPSWLRTGVSNFFSNIDDIWSTANLVLQVKPGAAIEMSARVVANSVFGVVGLFDVADEMGLERRSYEDFGQTLGRWGIGPGPYLVLPLLGPSNVRDGISWWVDSRISVVRNLFPDPSDRVAIFGVRALNARVKLLSAEKVLEQIALDRYVFIRDAYLARRRSLIYDGEAPDEPPVEPGGTPAEPSK